MKLSKIKKTIERVRELPTLPVVANKVTALLYDPKSNTSDLAVVIEKDQSITANILRLVNSAYYSLPERVTNINQAIGLLGYKNISHIVMTLSVFDTLRSSRKSSFDRKEFWIHSIATAIMSTAIAKMCMYPFPDDVFTSGLLHDLGKVFMDGFLHEEFAEVVTLADEKGMSYYDAERELFDVDHTMIGEWIARSWKLPLHIVATIKHHHQELEERQGLSLSSDVAIDFVRVADIGVRIKGLGKNGDGKKFKPQFLKEQFSRMPINEEDIFPLLDDLYKSVEKSEELLSLAVEG